MDWRKEVIEPVLDDQTKREIESQQGWIARDPGNPQPLYQLAQLYRMLGRRREALGLLLEAVRLDPAMGAAHVALCEIYAVEGDYAAAWRHARRAGEGGLNDGIALLRRHGVEDL